MRFKSLIQLLSISLFAVAILALASCGGDDETTTEEVVVVETTPPPPPPPPPVAKKRTEVKKKTVKETPEEFVVIEEDEVETIDNVEFVPHRFTYHSIEAEKEPLHVNMKAFDVAPIFGNRCLKQDHPDVCSQEEIERYLKNNNKFPEEAKSMEDPVEYVSFVVEVDGKINKDDIHILPQEPQCRTCAAEALVLVRNMPKWIPAQKGGTPVAARVTIPIRFKAD